MSQPTAPFEPTDACVSSLEGKDYPLHQAVFENNLAEAKKIIKEGNVDITKKNAGGDTALHVATMLGHREMIQLLLAADAPVNLKNNNGWSPLVEAISYGSRDTITEMLKASRTQARAALSARKPHLFKMLNELQDFTIEFKWVFTSWIPFLSKILPSDVCRIYKKGCALRMDSSLLDLNDKSLERGNISFIFNPDLPEGNQFIILDNNAKTYQRMKHDASLKELEEEIDVLMSSDIIDASMSTKPITFNRLQTGWFFKQDRSEDVCGYASNFYEVQNLNLITRKRREHLTDEEVKKNKSIMQKFANGKVVNDDEMKWSERRNSIDTPTKPMITFEEYTNSIDPVPLGRTPKIKTSTKSFSASVAMSEEFPLNVNVLVDILEVLAPTKHMYKLKQFCQFKLPPGFPVKLEIPIFATISAKVTFQQFEWRTDLTDRMFQIPKNYKKDHGKLPNFL